MRILLLAILIASQTAPPAPRQAIKDHTDKGEAKTPASKDSQQPTDTLPPKIPVNTTSRPNSATKSADKKAQDASPNTPKKRTLD